MATTYANLISKPVNGNTTVFNTTTNKGYSTPDELAADLGVPKEQIQWGQIKSNPSWSPSTGVTANSPINNLTPPSNTLPSNQANRNPVPAPAQPVSNTTYTPYTPPNQGTTGVSQGGIIGNLLGIANNETPQVKKAREDLKKLEENYATQTSNLEGLPIDLSLAGGQQGILNRLFAAKQGAAQTALSSSLTSQGQQIQATQGAGSLNAPIVNPQTQGLVSPSSNLTTGATTSGPTNLGALIGTRPSPSNPNVLEYYPLNDPTHGFPTPQDLANYVNQQLGTQTANASNVFDIIKQNQAQTGDVVKPSDPYYQTLVTAANLLATNQVEAANSLMGSMPAAVKAQVIRMAQGQGYNSNVAAGAAQAQQQNTFQAGTVLNNAAYQDVLNRFPNIKDLAIALNNVDDAGNLTIQNTQGQNINPFTFVPLNKTIAEARNYFSSAGQAVFQSNLVNLKNLIRSLNANNGGGTIPSQISGDAEQLVRDDVSMQTLQALINTARQEGQLRFNNAMQGATSSLNQVQNTGGSNGYNYNSGNAIPDGTIAAGGALIYRNGQWQAR